MKRDDTRSEHHRAHRTAVITLVSASACSRRRCSRTTESMGAGERQGGPHSQRDRPHYCCGTRSHSENHELQHLTTKVTQIRVAMFSSTGHSPSLLFATEALDLSEHPSSRISFFSQKVDRSSLLKKVNYRLIFSIVGGVIDGSSDPNRRPRADSS